MYTLENTYHWLVNWEVKYPYHALGVLVGQLNAAASANDAARVAELVDELKFAADRLADPLQRAQVRLECARAYHNVLKNNEAMDEIGEAIKLLDKASAYDGASKHYYAVAKWMLGDLLLELKPPPHSSGKSPQSGNPRKEALVAWQTSLNEFTSLVVWPVHEVGSGAWYQDRCAEMRQGIDRLLLSPRPAPAPTARKGAAAGATPPPPKFKFPISTLYAGNIQSLAVVGQIPAGGFGPTGMDPHTLEKVRLLPSQDKFTIGGKTHRLVNLRGSPGVTELVSSRAYFILRVKGDSMNADHIDPGDYVLVRQQDSADPMDIVAAEVVHTDAEATLKRFVRRDRQVILEPRSTNPNHPTFTFTEPTRNFFIRGVALAVFKP